MPLLCFPVRFILSDEYDEEATGARIDTSMSMSMMVEARAGKGKGLATFTYHIIVQWHKVKFCFCCTVFSSGKKCREIALG